MLCASLRMSVPSLHRESTDSLPLVVNHEVQYLHTLFRSVVDKSGAPAVELCTCIYRQISISITSLGGFVGIPAYMEANLSTMLKSCCSTFLEMCEASTASMASKHDSVPSSCGMLV